MPAADKKFKRGMIVGVELTAWVLLIIGGFWGLVLAILASIGWAVWRLLESF